MRSSILAAAAAAGLLAVPAPARAQSQAGSANASTPLRALEGCRVLSADAARLACYDRVAAELTAAERSGEVVVVDREQVRAARRQAFGFNLPSLDLFGRRGATIEAVDRAALVLARAYQDADGKWVMRTQEGQVWRQTDTERLARAPRAGSKAEVRRATLGSYLMNVDGQRAIRVRREQ